MTSERDTEATGAEGRLDWLRTSMVTEPSGAADAAWARSLNVSPGRHTSWRSCRSAAPDGAARMGCTRPYGSWRSGH